MSSPSNKSAEKTSKEVPKDELETKDATDDATPATVPDPKDEPQDDENYLDESPHASQTDTKKSPAKNSPTKKSPTKRSPAKSTAKPEAAAHTGEKRQRSIAEMLGGGKGKAVVKKARASSPAGDEEGAAGEEGEASTSTPSRRTVNGLTALKFIPFSMEEFTNGLTDDQKRLLQLEIDTLNKSWFKVLKDELTKPYFIKLKQFLWDEGVKDANTPCPSIYPPAADIYTWSRCTPLGRVKVVIIGQDPYHGPKQAHGLCFSVRPGVAVPPSLRNMYKEIQSSYPSFTPPKHGSLISWANQGVLMLNTSLTVRAGQAGSHAGKGWETFTDAVVKAVDKYGGASLPGGNGVGRGVVFLAWGSWASKRVAGLDKKKHCILASAHPSPLSAHRGFLGNGHFKKTNDWLSQRYGIDNVIDWCALDADAKAGGEA